MRRAPRTLTIAGLVAAATALAGFGSAALAEPPASPATPAPAITISPAGARIATPALTVVRRSPGLQRGVIFSGPKFNATHDSSRPVGVMISDDYGRPVYFGRTNAPNRPTDVRVQSYDGKPVMTYWLGKASNGVGFGNDYIVDQHYHVLKVVHSHLDRAADQHEFLLTHHGTAIIDSYQTARRDARAEGGAKNQLVYNATVEEIDLKTSKVVFRWQSLAHVPLSASHVRAPRTKSGGLVPNGPYDYFHINSINFDSDGNLIISSRHTWAVYKVSHRTGKIIWSLGGKNSSFTFGDGSTFAWQHNAVPVGNNTYRIFDNEWNLVPGQQRHTHSQVIWDHVDTATHRATLLRRITYPGNRLLAGAQGNSQALANGDTFISWGSANRITEFSPKGALLFDSYLPKGMSTYRAYRARWSGSPTTLPALSRTGDKFDVVWNGASGIKTWRLLGGSSRSTLHVIGSTAWNGFDTGFTMSLIPHYIQATAIRPNGTRVQKTRIFKTS